MSKFLHADSDSGSLILKKQTGVIDLASFSPLLTWQHERRHYTTLLSIAAGILLWRLNTDILSTAIM
jgi:hypothetical protein